MPSYIHEELITNLLPSYTEGVTGKSLKEWILSKNPNLFVKIYGIKVDKLLKKGIFNNFKKAYNYVKNLSVNSDEEFNYRQGLFSLLKGYLLSFGPTLEEEVWLFHKSIKDKSPIDALGILYYGFNNLPAWEFKKLKKK